MTTSLRAKVDRTRAFEEETLYTHPLAPYCHKVLIALYEHGIECDKRIVNLGDSAERTELATISPFAKFPVLRDHAHKRDVAESSIVIETLDHHFVVAHPMIPSDRDAAAPALFYAVTLEPFPDGAGHLQAYFDRLMERPPVRRVMEEAKPFFSFYPFAEGIPQRFR